MQFLSKLKKIKIHTWPFIPRVKPKGALPIRGSLSCREDSVNVRHTPAGRMDPMG